MFKQKKNDKFDKSADDCTRARSHLPDACLACDYPGAVSVPVAERQLVVRRDRVGIRTD